MRALYLYTDIGADPPRGNGSIRRGKLDISVLKDQCHPRILAREAFFDEARTLSSGPSGRLVISPSFLATPFWSALMIIDETLASIRVRGGAMRPDM
mmetsp:Transcript_6877/g.15934  ORF Transcript_6877/g.15934 Transcript_6877/m.15934 type:complete len:97 (+) Transcript_6877:279-569(+)